MAKGLSAAKAKRILEDGYVKGKPLTAKQKKYFGAIANGATPLKAINGAGVPKAQIGLANKLYKLFKGADNVADVANTVRKTSNVVDNTLSVKPFLPSDITARRLAGNQLYNIHNYTAKQLDQLLKESRAFLKNTPNSGYENSVEFTDNVLRKIQKLEPGVQKDLKLQEIAERAGRTNGDDTGKWLSDSYINSPANEQLGHVTTSNNLWDIVFKSNGDMIPYKNSEALYFNQGGKGQLARSRMMAPENQGGAINLIFDNKSLKNSNILGDVSGGEYTISQNVNLKHLYPKAKIKAKDLLLNEAEFRGIQLSDDFIKSIDNILDIKKNGGWLDKFGMGGSLPGASGMMYSRNSGSSAMSPPNLTKAQDGDEFTLVPEGGIELDEVLLTGKSKKRKEKDKRRKKLFEKMPDYLRYGDDDRVLSFEEKQQLKDLGITDVASYNEYFGTDYSEENAGNEYLYLNDYKPQMEDMISSIHGATNEAAKNFATFASFFIPAVRGAGMVSKVPQAYRYLANSPVGRAAYKYVANPAQKTLNYKPFKGPVSISNIIDGSSAAYAGYATPGAYEKYKENPSFDTGLDLGLTAIDLVPFGEIFTGGKNIKNLYNKGKNLFTNDLKPNPNMYYRGIGQSGLDDITESGLLRAKPADKIPFNGMGTKFDFAKRFNNLYVTPRLNVADQYGRGVVAEIPKDVADFSKRYKNSDWSMMTDNQIPIEEVNLYKKNFFGNYKPVNIPQPPLSSMPFSKPNIYPTSSPLLKDMEPYLSRKVYPFNKEQEVFESFLSTDRRLKNIDSKSLYYNQAGKRITKGEADNLLYPPEYQKNGGEVDKAQFGKLLKLVKKYGKKLFNFAEPAAKVDNTPSLKYTDDVDLDMDVFNKKTRDAAAAKKQLETAKENIEQGESWKYKPGELEKLEARSKFLDETLDFPFSDNSSDVWTNLTRYGLSDYLKKGLDKPFGTIGNSYRTGYGHLGLDYKTNYLNDLYKDYTVGLPDGSRVPYGKLDGDMTINPDSFNSLDEASEQLRRNAQEYLGKQWQGQFEKPSRIDFGDLLRNKNRNGGWLSKYENGGVIEDDRGQWAHPGKVTKINSNNITMKGVNYPVLGVSDTGDTKMMQPGVDNYKYDGNSVTEYPMAQDGLNAVPDPTPQINFMKDWANSAMHNKMLNASSSSDKFKNKVKSVRGNFDDVTIGMFDDPGYLGQYLNSNIRMNPSLLKEAPIGNGYNSILTHELSHYTDDANPSGGYFKGYNIPLSDQKLIKDYSKQGIKRAKSEEKELNELLKSENMNPNSKDVIKDRVKRLKYLASPTETRSRINATRYFYENDKNFGRSSERNIDKNLPSIFDSEVTPDMIKVMQESGQYKQLQEIYTDDQILEMFNTISDNSKSSGPSNMAYAQEGAGVNKEGVKQYKWFKNYMRSPKYKERLKKEFPDYTDKQIGQEVKSRLENVMQTRVGFLPRSSDISTGVGGTQGVYNADEYPGAIMLRPEYSASTSDVLFEPGNYLSGYNTIPLHEWSHAADDGGNRMPQSTTDLMLSKMKENSLDIPKDVYYYTKPTEYLGRMQPLRYLMQQEGLYDAGTQNFTKEDLEKAKQNKTIKNNQHFQDLMKNVKSDEGFIELMNNVASLDNSKSSGSSSMAYAKQGRSLEKKAQLTNFTNYNTPQPGGWLDKY